MILHRGGGIRLFLYPECTEADLILSKRLSPNPFPDSRCCGNCFEMYRMLLVVLLSFSCWLSDRLAPRCFPSGFIGEMHHWSMIFHWAIGGCRLHCAKTQNQAMHSSDQQVSLLPMATVTKPFFLLISRLPSRKYVKGLMKNI